MFLQCCTTYVKTKLQKRWAEYNRLELIGALYTDAAGLNLQDSFFGCVDGSHAKPEFFNEVFGEQHQNKPKNKKTPWR
ncbi:hypothetical protein L596_013855 [Steinernema carpocapsae]|uniref:Uncharacterized protein n=1 Tax=Steinernema carpocapsae TaxID=34508 RepID=A0A4U5P2F0_STECR|nr:hypothetical protein L596_013855 [Steinernema carpocapsae]